jgi:hypothetical protein
MKELSCAKPTRWSGARKTGFVCGLFRKTSGRNGFSEYWWRDFGESMENRLSDDCKTNAAVLKVREPAFFWTKLRCLPEGPPNDPKYRMSYPKAHIKTRFVRIQQDAYGVLTYLLN